MCGICGVVALDGALDPAIRRAVPAMTRLLEHRGPDGEGFFGDNRAALGHRRLAIIDRAGGAQPISNEDESHWVIFNGEIYNHLALRRELLERGHRFKTLSDTEVILHAYEEFGAGAVERLEGMFAFAVWNRRDRELFVARDRVGKKPLFYAILDGVLHFASELKALTASPAWNDEIDSSSLETYLSLGYIVAPQTIYRHARKLEPGHWLRVRRGNVEIRKYWDIERFGDDLRPLVALEEAVESALSTAVRDRLESEVPLGVFLSGGIDSGLVVSMVSESLKEPVITTSVGFSDPRHNELAAARLTAQRFGTAHHEAVTDARPAQVLDQIVAAFDEPFADASAVPTFYVAAIAREHVTVALTGDGGDETFGGYSFRYVPHALEHCARRVMPASLGGVAGWLGARWPRRPWLPRYLRLRTILENLSRSPELAYATDLCVLAPPVARTLLGRAPLANPYDSLVYETVTAPYRQCPSHDPVLRAQYADLKVYLPNDVLVKVDRMTMAHSLEVRSPLLDRRVVEMAFAIPTSSKMPGLRPKHLLKQIAQRRLPPDVQRLPKHGFDAPIGRWLVDPHGGMFRDEVLSPGAHTVSMIDHAIVARMFEEQCNGLADHSYTLWAIWMLERWARTRPRPRVDVEPLPALAAN